MVPSTESSLAGDLPANLKVIIPAAGIGARVGGDRPKQYQLLNDRFLLDVTLQRLSAALPGVRLLVMLHPDDVWWSRSETAGLALVDTATGGDTRADSVRLGLAFHESDAKASDPVLVHDVARPCFTAGDIHRLLHETARSEHGGLLGAPVPDTVKEVDNGRRVRLTRDRRWLWRALTPQVFPYGALKQALHHAQAEGLEVTDEASAMEALGYAPLVVPGRSDNLKVTYPEDLALAAWYLQQFHEQHPETPK